MANNGIPMKGDRSARDVINFPAEHASDLENGADQIHHLPAPGTAGNIVVDDGTKWVSQENLGPATADHDHSGDAGDGGAFDAANLTSGASTDGQVLTSDGLGGAAWENPTGGSGLPEGGNESDVLTIVGGVPSWAAPTGGSGGVGKIQITIDGKPDTGFLLDFQVPYNITITDWTIISTYATSIVFDLWRDAYANYPPTVEDTQVGDQKPALSSEFKVTSSTLTHWTADWNLNDLVRVNIDSRESGYPDANRLLLILSYTRR